MANEKRVFSAIDSAPAVLYAKTDPASELAYPIIMDASGMIVPPSQLNAIQNAIAALRSTIGIASDLRVTLLSGTVTTVSSVTNVASIGSINANAPLTALMNLAYIQSNHNNLA